MEDTDAMKKNAERLEADNQKVIQELENSKLRVNQLESKLESIKSLMVRNYLYCY